MLGPKEVEKLHHLMPELCYLHPLPASVWKQVVWVPSVLHRLTGLLLAEELRLTINRDARIGMEFLPGSVNVSSVWRPIVLRNTLSKCSPPLEDPRLLPHCFRPQTNSNQTSLKKNDSFDPDDDLVWNTELTLSSDKDDSALATSHSEMLNGSDPANNFATWSEETRNLRFDNSSTSAVFGPSPGQVLEALTTARSNDGYDLERLETIGDSILKLVISVCVFGGIGANSIDEGLLTELRTLQINNQHLFQLGLKKNLGRIMSAQGFDIGLCFLPPCFLPIEKTGNGQKDLRRYQMVATKNIADSIEALIGLYLLATGTKGALTVMNWLGLKTLPEIDQDGYIHGLNEINGFPIIRLPEPCNGVDDFALERLFAGLESFEKRLDYTFKDKRLLIEALTHPSYNHATNNPNRLTSSYQRLEFLGDAVLGK